MKIAHKLFPLISIFCFLFSGCQDDENDQICCDYSITLEGDWNLTNISGGFAGVDYTFETGDMVWNFDTSTNTVNVTNTITDNTIIHTSLETGTYSYTIIEEDNSEILIINDIDFRIITLTDTSLSLDDNVAADGFLYSFSR